MNSDFFFTLQSGEQIPIIIETRHGVRNVTLRPKTMPKKEIHVTKPWSTSTKFVLNFVESKQKWIEKIFNSVPSKEHVKPGDTVEFFGRNVLLKHDENIRSNKYLNTDKTTLCIGGGADMFERRVRDFIKSELLEEIKIIIKTTPREYWPKHISLRDTTSRWGSCSSTGNMSFSWRLAFAPYEVMRYVVMHELSHTKHMDHSPEFWATVSQLYGFGVERAKRWLAKNGQSLHKYF
ncbi:MAG: M48 family metallopeptidase [Alphaproteobacteria bacterium]|nr:M48 family metallopeptidase [Alphaproteobacteria bacterium]